MTKSSASPEKPARTGTSFGRDLPRAYSIDSVVEICGLGRTSVYGEIKAGRLVARKCGRRTLVIDEDLQRWLETLPVVSSGHAQ
jgi:hypothetical protein